MPRDREYELKFTLDPRDAERLTAHPLVRPALRERQVDRLVSTYFDTPDGKLQRNRFGLRVRRGANGATHTLKHTGGSLVDRGEWERADEASRPDLAWLRGTPLAPLLDDDTADALAPRFTVEVTRTTLPVRHKRAQVEAAIDQGAIRAKGVSLPLSELELEVKQGRGRDMLDLARKLVRDLPLALSLASKSERGYGVSALTWGRPEAAITPALRRRMTIAEAFEAIAQACLHVFLKNIALVRGDDDDEAVHQARVALRHLRAALQLFAPALRRKRLAALRREVKWLSRKLGAARDADVFQTDFFVPAAEAETVVGAASLVAVMDGERRAAHARLRKALASRRARLLFVDVLAFSAEGVRRRARSRRFLPFSRRALEQRQRVLMRETRGLKRKSMPELHEVRKSAKMLRYDLDLVTEGAGGQHGAQLGKSLRTLQKSLGAIHDQAAMRAHVRRVFGGDAIDLEVAGSERRAASAAASRLAGNGVSRADALHRANKAARRLKAVRL